ncbi:MAG: hypothetical protein ABI634_04100 [Acidobacteriota bacterium]
MDTPSDSTNSRPSGNVVSLLDYKARRGQVARQAADTIVPAKRVPWLLPSPRQITHWRQMLTHLRATNAPS